MEDLKALGRGISGIGQNPPTPQLPPVSRRAGKEAKECGAKNSENIQNVHLLKQWT